MFDEETEARIDELTDELYAALVDDRDVRFWEGGIVQVAPTGAPPEYITVEIEGIEDESVMWRGVPASLQVGDEVLVWENPITHRREIAGGSGATTTSTSSPWQKVTVAVAGGDFALLSAAIVWINALPGAIGPAAARLFAINMLGGNFAEAGPVTIPQWVHVGGEGEGTEIEMGNNTLTLSSDSSLESVVVEGNPAGLTGLIYTNNVSNVVMRNVWGISTLAGGIVFSFDGSSAVKCYDCVAECTASNAFGFYGTDTSDTELYRCQVIAGDTGNTAFQVDSTATMLLEHCVADDTTNINTALLLAASACTVESRYCIFRAASAGDDVNTGAGSTWQHLACNVDAQNVTIAGTSTPLEITPINLDGWADALILDADADTTISSPTDDQIDVEVGGSDVALFDSDGIDVQTLQLYDTTELTIAAGVITVTQSYHRIDTQGDAATDDLDTINGGVTGDVLIIRAENDARTVVVKHATGNIDLVDGTDITLDDTEDHLALIYDGAVWCDVKGRQIIANGVTKTVGGAGDFTTIQGAVDWFKNRLIVGLCKIDVDAGSYDEAVVFDDLFIAKGGALELEGDTRALAALSYVDGCVCNPEGLANGGTFAHANRCTLATNMARDQITVSGGTVDPDFNADGWGNGDEILVYADDGNFYERIVNSINPGGAGNNVIEITVALPGGATLGNDGTAIALKPDRQIERTAAGVCIYVDGAHGVLIDGWYLESATGADCEGLRDSNGGIVNCQNVLTYVEDFGFRTMVRIDVIENFSCSVWGGSIGFYCGHGMMLPRYACAVGCSLRGFQTSTGSIDCYKAIAVNCDHGFYANVLGFMYALSANARQNATTGYYAQNGSFLDATSTDRSNNGNGVDYNPAPPGLPGYGNGNGNADLYASN